MDIPVITKIPYTVGHTHFGTWVSDFPQLHQHDEHGHHGHEEHKPLSQKQQILDHLRKELVTLAVDRPAIEQKLCYRTCFKFTDREYAEYCLKVKCGQSDFIQAAKALNFYK